MTITKFPSYTNQYLSELPIGSVIPWPEDAIPSGWMIADGGAKSRTIYSELFDLYGETWGDGDGSTTFNIPFGDPQVLPWNAPRGRLASYLNTTGTNQTCTASTETDLNIASGTTSVSLTMYANRRYRIYGGVSYYQPAGAGQGFILQINVAGSGRKAAEGITNAALGQWVDTEYIYTPSSTGSVTVKLVGRFATNAGIILNDVSLSNRGTTLIIEDLGADITQSPYNNGNWIVKVSNIQDTIANPVSNVPELYLGYVEPDHALFGPANITADVTLDGDGEPTTVDVANGVYPRMNERVILARRADTSDLVIVGKMPGEANASEDTAWASITLTSSWANYDPTGATFNLAEYRKDRHGWVHLRGLITGGSAGASFSLPAGYRPPRGRHLWAVASNSSLAYVQVGSDGTGAIAFTGGSNAWVQLDGLSFPTWQDETNWHQLTYADTTGLAYGSDLAQDIERPALYVDDNNGMVYHRGLYALTAASDYFAMHPTVKSPEGAAVFSGVTSTGGVYTVADIRDGGTTGYGGFYLQSTAIPTTFLIPGVIQWALPEAESLWTTVSSFSNTWTHYLTSARTFEQVSYYKDNTGRVFLRGLMKRGAGSSDITGGSETSFTLPAGYRPARRQLHLTRSGRSDGMGRVDITSAGVVIVELGNQAWTSLAGINFLAEN
jgi:hypothetical protein